MELNSGAAAKVEEFLNIQQIRHMPTSMADIQSRYQSIPYGWKEIDIAAVVAGLLYDQKITIKYGGATIHTDNAKLPDMLRKKSETGKTNVSLHISIPAQKMRAAKELLRDYFDVMDVPDDENGLVSFIVEHFEAQKKHYEDLKERYLGHHYPDRDVVPEAIEAVSAVLGQQKDNIALIDALLKAENGLFDSKDAMQRVEGFFKNQVQVFDAAVRLEKDLEHDLTYLAQEEKANEALNQIRLITKVQKDAKTVYRKIPELNGLMDTVRTGHSRLLEKKRQELQEIMDQCMGQIYSAAGGDVRCTDAVSRAEKYAKEQREKVQETDVLALLDGMIPGMWSYQDTACQKIEALKKHVDPPVEPPVTPPAKVITKDVYRQLAFPAKTLKNQADIDAYVEHAREYLMRMLRDCDEISLK